MGEQQSLVLDRTQRGEQPSVLQILDAALEIVSTTPPLALLDEGVSERGTFTSSLKRRGSSNTETAWRGLSATVL